MRSINYFEAKANVKVRKHEVDKKSLCKLLRKHRTISYQEIATTLNVPLTNVSHWFRADEYFSIPDANIWMDLKNLLGITVDDFDKAITEFEVKPNVFEKGDRLYLIDMCSPTITLCQDIRIVEVKKCKG